MLGFASLTTSWFCVWMIRLWVLPGSSSHFRETPIGSFWQGGIQTSLVHHNHVFRKCRKFNKASVSLSSSTLSSTKAVSPFPHTESGKNVIESNQFPFCSRPPLSFSLSLYSEHNRAYCSIRPNNRFGHSSSEGQQIMSKLYSAKAPQTGAMFIPIKETLL